MLQPVEAMLAKWPMLYPEITDADEAARVREEVITPILVTPRPLRYLRREKGGVREMARLPTVRGRRPGNPAGPGGPEG